MGAKIADYKSLIDNLKTEAVQAGDAYLECSAKELMGKLNEGNATLITCCSAMRQCMLSGDEMIVAPTGKKNVSTGSADQRPARKVKKQCPGFQGL